MGFKVVDLGTNKFGTNKFGTNKFGTKLPSTQIESYPESALRQVARTGVRGVEAALDVPIGLASLVKPAAGLIGKGAEALMDVPGKLGLPGVSSAIKGVSEFLGEGLDLAEPPITSAEQIVSEPLGKILPEGYLKPKGKIESFTDSIVSDFVPLLIGKVPTKYAALGSILGNVAPFMAKMVGFGEKAQTGIKIGTILGTTMLGTSNLKKHAKDLYVKSGLRLSEGETVSARSLKPFLREMSTVTEKGLKTPTKTSLKDIIRTIKTKISPDDEIPIKELVSMKQDVNELIADFTAPKRFKKLLPKLSQKLNQTIKEYSRINPQFWKEFSTADEIYRNLYKKTFIDKIINKSKLIDKVSPITLGLLFGAKALGVPYAGTIAHGALGGYLASKGVKQLSLLKSPAIRKYYAGVMTAAAKQNIPSMTKNLNKLDKLIKKENQTTKTSRFKRVS